MTAKLIAQNNISKELMIPSASTISLFFVVVVFCFFLFFFFFFLLLWSVGLCFLSSIVKFSRFWCFCLSVAFLAFPLVLQPLFFRSSAHGPHFLFHHWQLCGGGDSLGCVPADVLAYVRECACFLNRFLLAVVYSVYVVWFAPCEIWTVAYLSNTIYFKNSKNRIQIK